jgi:hypothetical protein
MSRFHRAHGLTITRVDEGLAMVSRSTGTYFVETLRQPHHRERFIVRYWPDGTDADDITLIGTASDLDQAAALIADADLACVEENATRSSSEEGKPQRSQGAPATEPEQRRSWSWQ